MSDDFTSCALHEVRRSLAELIVWAGLHRKPETVSQAVARRVKAQMKMLETILRRLIMLIALTLTLAPVKPRAPKQAKEDDDQIVTKSHPPYSFGLSGQVQVYTLDGPAFPDGERQASGPVPTAGLLRRYAAFARILKNPDRYARRVARSLERLRAAGEPRPLCLTLDTRRLHPELGVMASGLPMMLAAAFSRWNDTG